MGDTRTLRKLAGSAKVVCATAKNLTEEIKAGRFRDDLYQRIQEFRLHCEPLAKRPEDVRLLVRHFLATEPELQQSGPFSDSDIDYWINWNYARMGRLVEASQGNIRGLQQRVHRTVSEGKLSPKGDRPVEDCWGAMIYTREEIERYDWKIALELCRFKDKDAGRLMGQNANNTSKILMKLRLSKKHRKGQERQQ